MLESSPIATRIEDVESKRVVFANSSYISLIGSTPGQVLGTVPSDYYAHPEVYAEAMKQLRQGGYVTNKLVELRPPGGHAWIKWVLASYFPVEYENKPAILGWFYDITDHKLNQDRAEYMAHHDPLTGLPNRPLFLDRLHLALAGARRERTVLALLFIDLDKFKPVNDRHGHQVGDLLLKAVAERILGCLRETDSAARFGGDEFVALLPSVGTEANAMGIAEEIRSALNRPFEIEGLTLDIASSTGVALYPDHADSEQQLIERADLAMYHAKSEGRNCVRVYRPELSKESA
jgi:diguanylate cyclase (GGDEF)-like protein/PAS domain S-box-containing protein